MLYQLEDLPPMGVSVLLALQHILAAFAGIIAVIVMAITASRHWKIDNNKKVNFWENVVDHANGTVCY